jgi:hypothetical protein
MKLIGPDLGYMSLISRVMSLSLPNAESLARRLHRTHAFDGRPMTAPLGLREARTAQRNGFTPARHIITRDHLCLTLATFRPTPASQTGKQESKRLRRRRH